MSAKSYSVPCAGIPCDKLGLKRENHRHMPPMPHDGPNLKLEITDPEALAVRSEIMASYDGLTAQPSGERDVNYEFARSMAEIEQALGSLSMFEIKTIGAS